MVQILPYTPVARPFKTRTLPDGSILAVSSTGDHAFLTSTEHDALRVDPTIVSLERQAELRARFFIGTVGADSGSRRLARSRVAAKRETVRSGPSLHIIVPTLQCGHSCRYCQVSRSLNGDGHTMSLAHLDATCDTIFGSPAKTLTVEFQGGDPLLRFDLVRHAILRLKSANEIHGRSIRFVVASTLHQLTEGMCDFFKEHEVILSTSIDGPAHLHNKNRPTPTRDSYQRTVAGIALALSLIHI